MTTPRDPWFRNRKIRDGIYRAIEHRMESDPRILLFGEGAHMKIHFDAPSIEKNFPDQVITLPISEDGNTNFAVGLALGGQIPVVDVISSDFLFRTFDAIANTCRVVNYVADEPYTIVIRAEFLTGGPTTGQRIEGLFCGIPGLHVAVPSRAEDAEIMMHAALNRKGVTLFFEDRMIEDVTEPDGYAESSVGGIRMSYPGGLGAIVRPRRGPPSMVLPEPRVTVVSYGYMARQLEVWLRDDERVELIDLRWLKPLDIGAIWKSVSKTNALLIVESGTTHTIAPTVTQNVVGSGCDGFGLAIASAAHVTIPASRELHADLWPDEKQIRTIVDSLSLAEGPR